MKDGDETQILPDDLVPQQISGDSPSANISKQKILKPHPTAVVPRMSAKIFFLRHAFEGFDQLILLAAIQINQ